MPTYDVHLAKTMEGIDFDQPLPPMWPQFDGLGRVPLMVLRGAELGPAVGDDGRGHADAAAGDGNDHGAGPGPRADPERRRPDRPPGGIRRVLRAGTRRIDRAWLEKRPAKGASQKENPGGLGRRGYEL